MNSQRVSAIKKLNFPLTYQLEILPRLNNPAMFATQAHQFVVRAFSRMKWLG